MTEHCEIFEGNIRYRLSYNSQKIRITLFTKLKLVSLRSKKLLLSIVI